MRHFLGNGIIGLRDALLRNKEEKALRRTRAVEIINTVESVVDGTDSKIRLVPGYRKQLQNTILSSLEYADDLVNQIPEPIEINRRTFTSDPYVNAFFANVRDLRSILSHSSEVQEFMADNHDSAHCCALLCMKRTERTVMGMELSGDVLKKDVLQVSVSFGDHRIYSPAPSEPEAREGLKNCLFQGLVSNALERIMQLRLVSHRLQSKHQMLHSRLRRYRQNTREVQQGTRHGAEIARKIEQTSLELERIETKMLHSPLLTPQVMLEQVVDVFSKPDDFIRIRKLPLRLNKMGIKINDDSAQAGNELDLTEVIIGNDFPRVVTLATFPKQELLPAATGAFRTRLANA
jgi:hypothetical protein